MPLYVICFARGKPLLELRRGVDALNVNRFYIDRHRYKREQDHQRAKSKR